MRIIFPISYRNEPELMALYHKLGSKDFMLMVKDALRHTIRPHYVGKVEIPDNLLLEAPTENIKIRLNLSISSAKDADVNTLLRGIKPQFMTKFIKQCLKLYLGTKGFQAYFNDEYSDKLAQLFSTQSAQIVYQFHNPTIATEQQVIKKPSTKPRIPRKTKSAGVFEDFDKNNYPEIQTEAGEINIHQPTIISPEKVFLSSQEKLLSVESSNKDNNKEMNLNVEGTEDDILAMLEALLS